MTGLEGAEPARIDKRGALGRPSATFEGKPVGGRAAKVRVQRDFALCRDFGQLNAVLAGGLRCLGATRSSQSSPASLPRGDGA